MSHAVHFRDAAGEIRLEDVASLDAAVERVERLRNDDEVTDIKIFREVPIEVRTYYRVVAVEEGGASVEGSQAPAAPEAPTEPPSGAMVMSRPPVAVPSEVPTEEVEAADAAGGEPRRQLFSRS